MKFIAAVFEEIAKGICAVVVTLCTLLGGEIETNPIGDPDIDGRCLEATRRAMRARKGTDNATKVSP